MPIEIDDTMEEILDLFCDGRCTTGYLVDKTGTTRNTVTKRLDRLRAGGAVRYVHEPTALQELVFDPRSDAGDTTESH